MTPDSLSTPANSPVPAPLSEAERAERLARMKRVAGGLLVASAVLWVAAQAFAWLLARLSLDAGNLAAAGMRGIGTSFKAVAVGIPLVAVTVSDESVGLAAALLYALAFTLELAVSLVTYFGEEAKA